MGDLQVDTRLEGGDGRYRAALSPDWEIWGPNGGYLAVLALRAAADGPGLEHRFGEAPRVPEPDTLPSMDELRDPEWPVYPFWQNLDARPLHPERFREPPRPRDPVHVEWFRYRPRATFDDPFVDAGRSLLLLDTLSWPAACRPHQPNEAFIAPNLDVSAWFHDAAPDEEWLLADHESRVATGGLMGTTGRVWSRDGRLLASGGAQLYCVPAPAR